MCSSPCLVSLSSIPDTLGQWPWLIFYSWCWILIPCQDFFYMLLNLGTMILNFHLLPFPGIASFRELIMLIDCDFLLWPTDGSSTLVCCLHIFFTSDYMSVHYLWVCEASESWWILFWTILLLMSTSYAIQLTELDYHAGFWSRQVNSSTYSLISIYLVG